MLVHNPLLVKSNDGLPITVIDSDKKDEFVKEYIRSEESLTDARFVEELVHNDYTYGYRFASANAGYLYDLVFTKFVAHEVFKKVSCN